MMKVKINNNFLKKINNLIFATIGILIIVLSIKYNQYSAEKKTLELVKLTKNEYFKETTKFFLGNLKSNFFNISHVIQKGENLNEILKSYKIPQPEIEVPGGRSSTSQLILQKSVNPSQSLSKPSQLVSEVS